MVTGAKESRNDDEHCEQMRRTKTMLGLYDYTQQASSSLRTRKIAPNKSSSRTAERLLSLRFRIRRKGECRTAAIWQIVISNHDSWSHL